MPLTTCSADNLAFTVFRVLQKAAGSRELLEPLNLRACRQARGCLQLETDDEGTVRRALQPKCGEAVKAIKDLQCGQTEKQQKFSVL